MPKTGQWWTLAWMNLHLLASMGIVGTGAAVLNVVEHSGESLAPDVRWLLVGSLAAALAGVALLMATLRLPEAYQSLYRRAGWLTLFSALVSLLLGITTLATMPLLLLLNALLLLPVLYGIKVWIVVFDAQEFAIDTQ